MKYTKKMQTVCNTVLQFLILINLFVNKCEIQTTWKLITEKKINIINHY